MKTTAQRFDEKWMPEPNSGCWLWTGALNSKGYGTFYIRGMNRLASHASWILFRGEIPKGICVLHRCDTPACINPEHLFLGTQIENIHDCVRKKRHGWPKGVDVNTARLSENQVLEIRADTFTPTKELAKRFDVCFDTIWSIRTGKSWKHL